MLIRFVSGCALILVLGIICQIDLTQGTDDAVKQIDQCCTDWSAGRLKPHWLIIKEPKFGRSMSDFSCDAESNFSHDFQR